jgi:hypothetical protein
MIKELVRDLLKSTATSNQKAIWDDTIGKKYPNLVWSKLGAYITKTKKLTTWGVNQLSDLSVCNLSQWNRWVGNDKEEQCPCDTAYCCPGGGEECASEEVEFFLDRRSFTPWEDFYIDEDGEADLSDLDERADRPTPGGSRPYNITFPDGTWITVYSEEVSDYFPDLDSVNYLDTDIGGYSITRRGMPGRATIPSGDWHGYQTTMLAATPRCQTESARMPE